MSLSGHPDDESVWDVDEQPDSPGHTVPPLIICFVLSQVKLSSLNLDEHARKKLLKLVGDRHCRDTDVLSITADR